MNIDLKERALTKAKELYPESSMDELIIHASKLESYFTLKQQIDSLPHFASNCLIQHSSKGSVNFIPYPAQLNVLEKIQNNNHVLINTPRQLGTTSMICFSALWDALRKPYQTVVVMDRTFNQVRELHDRIEFAYHNLMGLYPKITQNTSSSMAFNNGSVIHFKSGTADALRGMTINAFYLDSAAFISHSRLNDLWTSIAPAFLADTRIVMASSGGGSSDGLFYELWKANNDFTKIKLHWSDHPERDNVWADTTKHHIGLDRFKSEFECEFTSK